MLVNRFNSYAKNSEIVRRLHEEKKHLPWRFGCHPSHDERRFVLYRGKKLNYYRYNVCDEVFEEVLDFFARRSSIITASSTTGSSSYTHKILASSMTSSTSSGSPIFSLKRGASYTDGTDFFSYTDD